jgi:uncharacterized protein
MAQEEIVFYGHRNVQSFHTRTIEITKDPNLTLRGDCIIGVSANKSCWDISDKLKHSLKDDDSYIIIDVIVGNMSFIVNGLGNSRLILLSRHDIVIRKSSFICERTIAIQCNKASSDIPREMVLSLQNPETKGVLQITTE